MAWSKHYSVFIQCCHNKCVAKDQDSIAVNQWEYYITKNDVVKMEWTNTNCGVNVLVEHRVQKLSCETMYKGWQYIFQMICDKSWFRFGFPCVRLSMCFPIGGDIDQLCGRYNPEAKYFFSWLSVQNVWQYFLHYTQLDVRAGITSSPRLYYPPWFGIYILQSFFMARV